MRTNTTFTITITQLFSYSFHSTENNYIYLVSNYSYLKESFITVVLVSIAIFFLVSIAICEKTSA